jgi:hypothetical protein
MTALPHKIACTIGILFLAIAVTGGLALPGIDEADAATQKTQADGVRAA